MNGKALNKLYCCSLADTVSNQSKRWKRFQCHFFVDADVVVVAWQRRI